MTKYWKKRNRCIKTSIPNVSNWWNILRNEPKWCTHAAQSEKEKNKSIDVDATDDKDVPRPMGRKAAKAERKGKWKED
jgi:hypothetical protein